MNKSYLTVISRSCNGVETGTLIRAVKRSRSRFPKDYVATYERRRKPKRKIGFKVT